MKRKTPWTMVFFAFAVVISGCACNGNRGTESPRVDAQASQSTNDANSVLVGQGCMRTGCSGHICTESGESIISTCVWREEYACYQTARCEKQSDGKCGWTPSQELSSCLDKAKAK